MTKAGWLCVAAMLPAGCGSASSGSSTAANNPGESPHGAAAAAASGESSALPRVTGVPQQNDVVRLEVTEAGFFPASRRPWPGRRYYTVGVRGTSRSASGQLLGSSKGDDVVIDVKQFVFAQNDRGCISHAEFGVAGVANVFAQSMAFSPGKDTEGRLVFLVPDDTQKVRVLIAPAGTDGLAVPAGEDFKPIWPEPLHTIEDGTTMRILVLPSPATPAGLPPAAPGKELVMLDVVVQNLSADHCIEFQPSQQLRLIDAAGQFVMASPATQQIGCRMDDNDLIPPAQSRRVMAVYEMPAGTARRLQYRGFEKEETVVDIR
jgi:hypothetical protein